MNTADELRRLATLIETLDADGVRVQETELPAADTTVATVTLGVDLAGVDIDGIGAGADEESDSSADDATRGSYLGDEVIPVEPDEGEDEDGRSSDSNDEGVQENTTDADQTDADEADEDADDEDETYACDVDECDYEGDSERGLSVHQARAHSDSDEDDTEDSSEDSSNETEDEDADVEESDDEGNDSNEVWCGICGAGPFEGGAALSGVLWEHHRRAYAAINHSAIEGRPEVDVRTVLDSYDRVEHPWMHGRRWHDLAQRVREVLAR